MSFTGEVFIFVLFFFLFFCRMHWATHLYIMLLLLIMPKRVCCSYKRLRGHLLFACWRFFDVGRFHQGAPVNFGNKSKETPLHKAAMRGALRSVKLLVSHGADLTRVDSQGKTPREVAKAGNVALMDALTPEVYLEQDGEEEGEGDADDYDEDEAE